MAVISSDLLQALFTNYRVVFNNTFLAAQNESRAILDRIAMTVDSATSQEVYTWLGTPPKMSPWNDERIFDSLIGSSYTLVNHNFSAGIEVDRNTLEDDRFGLILPKVRQLALEAARYPVERAVTTLALGNTTGVGYDGQVFFSNAHVDYTGQAAQSNILTGTGVTLSAIRNDLISARVALRRFLDQQGRPLNINADLIVCPPELEDIFRQILNTSIIALGTGTQQTNVLQGAYDLLVDPYLTDTNDWYLMDTKEELKPLIYQNRRAPDFQAQDALNQEPAFNLRKFRYAVDSRFEIGYGLWQLAVNVHN